MGGQAMYQKRAGRVNYGFGIGHIPYMSSFLGLSQDSLAYKDGYIPTITYDIYNYRTFVDQGTFFSSFPLSQTLLWEASVSFTHYSFRIDRILTNNEDMGEGYIGYRSEDHTSELQSLMRTSYDIYCLKKKNY